MTLSKGDKVEFRTVTESGPWRKGTVLDAYTVRERPYGTIRRIVHVSDEETGRQVQTYNRKGCIRKGNR